MARIIKRKELIRTRLLKEYGSWIYCDACGENIGYLCYATYDYVRFDYQCSCGNHGSAYLEMDTYQDKLHSSKKLIILKNRLCCPSDQSPLITILKPKLKSYSLSIVCKNCKHEYTEGA